MFGDISISSSNTDTSTLCEDADIEDELDLAVLDWQDVIGDADFIELVVDNLDGTVHSELHEESSACSTQSDVPNAVLAILENVSFDNI